MSAFIPAEHFDAVMAPNIRWQDAYAFVETSARNLLSQSLQPGETFTTSQLVATLYDGHNDFTRQRIFAALKALAAHGLKDCWSPGQAAKVSFGRTPGVQKIWAAPGPRRCPQCKVVLL